MAAATDAAVTTATLTDGAAPTSPSQRPTGATPKIGATVSPFEDLHSSSVYDKTKKLCASEATQNFVVQFDHEKAEVAFNLEPEDLKELLKIGTPEGKVRWINIWTPTAQAPTMRVLGNHYGFSSRLQAIITMPPELKKTSEPPRPVSRLNKSGATGAVQSSESASEKGDIEHGSPTTETRIQREVPASLKKDLAIYRIVKDTMGFTSVDQGSRFICLGANWLHERGEEENKQLLQPKHWSWLTLCNDHTVISIQETPVFEHPGDKVLRQKELESMRSNAVGILCQLSERGIDEFKDNVIGLKSVRDTMKPDHGPGGPMRRTSSDVETTPGSDSQVEGSSNLFYYLFEDYGGAAAILEVSKKIVSSLDERVLASARRRAKLKTRDIIPDLHTLRKELRQLQNLFQSYKNMIRRISHPRHATTYGEIPSGPIHLSGDVKISQSARSRFDRLEDRLQMLMLNTIQECLEEQNALSDTYFKITTQKDSQATARLTGSATLLAKMSVFFLPISFMTAFFSVEIPDFVASYTPKTYYVAFGVIAGISFIALFFFSKLLMLFSDKLEEWAEQLMRKLRSKKD